MVKFLFFFFLFSFCGENKAIFFCPAVQQRVVTTYERLFVTT